MTALLDRIGRWWYVPAPAARLAALRLLIGGFALGYVLVRAPHLAGYGGLPERQFAPVGVATWLPEPLPSDALQLLVALTAIAGFAFVAGWQFRWSGPLFAVLLLGVTTYRSSWGQVFHTENLLVLHVLVLALSPAADALSLDARRSGFVPEEDGRYGWPVRLMCLLTVLTYFVTGQTKLRNAGLDWLTTDSLRNYIAYDNLRKAELGSAHSLLGAALVRHAWLFTPLAAFTLIVELGAPLAMLGGRLARAWALAAWLFHAGVLAMMAIVFPYPLFGVAFAPFFAVERLRLPSLRTVRVFRRLSAG